MRTNGYPFRAAVFNRTIILEETMTISEKVAYLKGLMEGLSIPTETPEGTEGGSEG